MKSRKMLRSLNASPASAIALWTEMLCGNLDAHWQILLRLKLIKSKSFVLLGFLFGQLFGRIHYTLHLNSAPWEDETKTIPENTQKLILQSFMELWAVWDVTWRALCRHSVGQHEHRQHPPYNTLHYNWTFPIAVFRALLLALRLWSNMMIKLHTDDSTRSCNSGCPRRNAFRHSLGSENVSQSRLVSLSSDN